MNEWILDLIDNHSLYACMTDVIMRSLHSVASCIFIRSCVSIIMLLQVSLSKNITMEVSSV